MEVHVVTVAVGFARMLIPKEGQQRKTKEIRTRQQSSLKLYAKLVNNNYNNNI